MPNQYQTKIIKFLPPTSNCSRRAACLTTETVQGASLALESVDDVQRSNSLALGVLSVCNSVTNDTLKEGLQDTTGLLVDH